jgi:hypothetical protein
MITDLTENPRVRSSILRLGTSKIRGLWHVCHSPLFVQSISVIALVRCYVEGPCRKILQKRYTNLLSICGFAALRAHR